MGSGMLQWLARWWDSLGHAHSVPHPPFKASKRTATIMYGLWYGRLTPAQARAMAEGWGFAPDAIEGMIAKATEPPSYWGTYPPAAQDAEPGAAP